MKKVILLTTIYFTFQIIYATEKEPSPSINLIGEHKGVGTSGNLNDEEKQNNLLSIQKSDDQVIIKAKSNGKAIKFATLAKDFSNGIRDNAEHDFDGELIKVKLNYGTPGHIPPCTGYFNKWIPNTKTYINLELTIKQGSLIHYKIEQNRSNSRNITLEVDEVTKIKNL